MASNDHTQSHMLVLAIALVIAGLALSVSMYYSARMISDTLAVKQFAINVNNPVNINPAVAAGAAQGQAYPSQAQAAPQAAPPSAAAGCGIPTAAAQGGSNGQVSVNVAGLPIRGSANAQVTLVEFSDFQCPFCVRVQATTQQIMAAYGTKVNMVHMNFIVHPTAHLAHVAVECAGDQNKYWEMHSLIFSQQKFDSAGLSQLASSLNLDMAKFNTCLGGTSKDAIINAQVAAGQAIGVSGTPTFVIGKRVGDTVTGTTIVGAYPYETFKAAIDAALSG